MRGQLVKLFFLDNAFPELRRCLHDCLLFLLHCFKLGHYLLNSSLPFGNLLRRCLWMDQGIKQKMSVLELENSFPKLLGLSDYSKLGRALKDMFAGLINGLLDLTTTHT